MVDRVEITDNQVAVILATEEDHFHDIKALEIKPGKLSESISAFANTSGGEVYVGVDEHKEDEHKVRAWRGFVDAESANAHLQVLEAMKPLGGHYPQPSPHFGAAISLLKILVSETALAKATMSGSRRCSGMLGINS